MVKAIKVMIKTAHQEIKGYKNSRLAQAEDNDCVVRALAVAGDTNYEIAHNFCKTYLGREPKKGVRTSTLHRLKHLEFNKRKFTVAPITSYYYEGSPRFRKERNPHGHRRVPMTVRHFIKNNPDSTFMVLVRGHIFTVVNGEIIGNSDDAKALRKKVWGIIHVD